MNYFKELFSDSGTASIARYCVALCYIVANVVAVYSAYMTKDNTALVATLLSAGTIMKIGQKMVEAKNE